MLPEVYDSSHIFAETQNTQAVPDGVPIASAIGDSHAALFGHGAFGSGDGKITFGTGSSVMTTLTDFIAPPPGITTTIAWSIGGKSDLCLRRQHPCQRVHPALDSDAAGPCGCRKPAEPRADRPRYERRRPRARPCRPWLAPLEFRSPRFDNRAVLWIGTSPYRPCCCRKHRSAGARRFCDHVRRRHGYWAAVCRWRPKPKCLPDADGRRLSGPWHNALPKRRSLGLGRGTPCGASHRFLAKSRRSWPSRPPWPGNPTRVGHGRAAEQAASVEKSRCSHYCEAI